MHACGHDGHTTTGLADWLVRGDSGRRGTARLFFQPAEEVGDGAPPMVAAGVVDDADYFFDAHLGCELDTGFGAAHAAQMPSSSKFDATITDYAAHAAGNPLEGRNALLAGATAALNLHAIARYAFAETYVNVGRMVAGTGRNILPDGCLLEFEVRTDSDEGVA
jgi:aminobenzoyl-glutamate utilization protein A